MDLEDNEIQERIENLNNINNNLDELEKLLDENLLNQSYKYIMSEISPSERVDLNWNLSYTIYTMYYCKY
jgi:hypothetical protein